MKRIDKERVRKVAADNPDLLDCRLAQRFGITVGKLRQILGKPGNRSELLNCKEMARSKGTPRPGGSMRAAPSLEWRHSRREALRKKLKEQDKSLRGAFNEDFRPARRPNGRGGPLDLP